MLETENGYCSLHESGPKYRFNMNPDFIKELLRKKEIKFRDKILMRLGNSHLLKSHL